MSHLCLIPDRGREQATLAALFLQAHHNYSCPEAEEFRRILCLQSFTVALCSSRSMFILNVLIRCSAVFYTLIILSFLCQKLVKPAFGLVQSLQVNYARSIYRYLS